MASLALWKIAAGTRCGNVTGEAIVPGVMSDVWRRGGGTW